MFGKKKELESTIEELKAKLSEQEAINARLELAIEEYKRKESAIANALTRAQSDAAKVLEEAYAEKQHIIDQADEDKAAAHAEAELILSKAQEEAEAIRLAAKENSRRSALKAEAFMQSYRESAKQLNSALQRAAETAAAQAEHFRSCIKEANLDNEIEMAGEYIPSENDSPAESELPETYASPAELMQSIYKIERRSTLPEEEIPEEAPAFEPDAELFADRGPTAMLKNDIQDNSEAGEEAAMFTVDEIMQQRSEPDAEPVHDPIDDALNAIIDDVLQDS